MVSQKLYQLEKEIATLLLEKLEHDNITLERAADIARYVRQNLPENLTDAQIDAITPTLDDKFIELASIVHHHMREKEKAETHTTANEAQKLIHQGNIEQALAMLKQHTHSKL